MSHAPGRVRDPIISYLEAVEPDASLEEITSAVRTVLGTVSASSVRSSLNLNTPVTFIRTARGRYRLRASESKAPHFQNEPISIGKAHLVHSDCFSWLSPPARLARFMQSSQTPPYGVKEYSAGELSKLRAGKGGIWRIPPSFDGHQRSPLPRFTVLDQSDKDRLEVFFKSFGILAKRALVPGANVAIASNPLLAHILSRAMTSAGFEVRGSIIRLTMTMRGGDRPQERP